MSYNKPIQKDVTDSTTHVYQKLTSNILSRITDYTQKDGIDVHCEHQSKDRMDSLCARSQSQKDKYSRIPFIWVVKVIQFKET